MAPESPASPADPSRGSRPPPGSPLGARVWFGLGHHAFRSLVFLCVQDDWRKPLGLPALTLKSLFSGRPSPSLLLGARPPPSPPWTSPAHRLLCALFGGGRGGRVFCYFLTKVDPLSGIRGWRQPLSLPTGCDPGRHLQTLAAAMEMPAQNKRSKGPAGGESAVLKSGSHRFLQLRRRLPHRSVPRAPPPKTPLPTTAAPRALTLPAPNPAGRQKATSTALTAPRPPREDPTACAQGPAPPSPALSCRGRERQPQAREDLPQLTQLL